MAESNQVYLKNYINLYLLWIYNIMQKVNLIFQNLLKLFKFQKSWNLTGWDQN